MTLAEVRDILVSGELEGKKLDMTQELYVEDYRTGMNTSPLYFGLFNDAEEHGIENPAILSMGRL